MKLANIRQLGLVQLFGVAGAIAISLAVNNGLGLRLANLDRTQISGLEKV